MKVKDLVEKLKEHPEEMEVVVDSALDYTNDVELCEIVVKKCVSFETTNYLSQASYWEKYKDAELEGDYVDEKVVYLM